MKRNKYTPSVFGVGYTGVGRHPTHHYPQCSDTRPYSIWRAMLRRCYYVSNSNTGYPDCGVEKEWLNFQVFADWYEINYPGDGGRYQLDKDIKIPGNKVYGPDACMFVTQQENLKARRKRHSKRRYSEQYSCQEG